MNIIWLEKAEQKYLNTLTHLLNNFPIEVATKLDEQTTKSLNYIANGSLIGQYSSKVQAYKIVILKYNILIYEKDGENLYITDFIATKTNHNLNS